MKDKITLLIDKWLAEHYNDETVTDHLSEAILNLVTSEIKKKLPKSIYLNGLRKFNKDIPTVNAFNSYRKEVLKILRNLDKNPLDLRTRTGKQEQAFISRCGNEHLII